MVCFANEGGPFATKERPANLYHLVFFFHVPQYLIPAKKVVLVHSLLTGPYGLLYG